MDMYQAFATFMRGMKMNKATWDSLSPEAQQIWDQLSQRDKNTSLRSRPGMSPSNTRRTPPQGPPSGAQPSRAPSALRSPPTQQQVDFHEIPDHVPTIDDQYQTNFLERRGYNVNQATHNTSDTTIALSNDTFYTPKPTEESNIFNIITNPPRSTTPNDKSSSAEDGERTGSSEKKLSNFIPRIHPSKSRRNIRMAIADSLAWENHFAKEYEHVATRIYLPRHYSTWHPRIAREV